MNLTYAVDRLYEAGWQAWSESDLEHAEDNRPYPSMLAIQREFARAGLELVGARPCLYARGKVAHLMYRHHGHPVSVFMIPNMTRPGVPGIPGTTDEVVDVLGHEATVWSEGGRTFVLVAREPKADVAQAVAFVQAALKWP